MQRGTAHAHDAGRRRGRLAALAAATIVLAGLPAAPAAAAAPTVTPATVTGVEGASFSGPVGSFSDTAVLGCSGANYTADVAWSDGSTSTATVGPPTNANLMCTYPVTVADHSFAEEGAQTFTLTVVGHSVLGGTGSATGNADVADAGLSSSPVPVTAPEAATFSATIATFADADPQATAGDFTATVDWGDGSTSGAVVSGDAAAGFGVFAGHAYAQPGAYAATVSVSDAGGARTSTSVPMTVADSPLQVAGNNFAGVEGQAVGGTLAGFRDPDTTRSAAYYSSSVAWGDGSTSTPTLTPYPGGGFLVTGSHVYVEPGGYTAQVTIADPAGQRAAVTTPFAIADAPLSSAGVPVAATEGQPFGATLAGFRDADAGRPAGHYAASVSWGDGATSTGAIAADGSGGYVVTGGHDYGQAGSYPIAVTVADPGGQQTTARTTASVADAPLTAAATALTGTAGTRLEATVATFADPDPAAAAGLFSATVAWGDGATTTDPAIAASPDGGFTVSAGHTYADAGTFTTTVTVTDRNGASATATGSAVIAALPPPPPPPPPPTTTTDTTPTPAPQPAPAPTKVTPATPAPPPLVGVSAPRLAGRTAFSLRLTCPAAATRCRGVARVITLPARAQKPPLRGGTTLGSTLFLLGSGESRTVTVAVPLRLRRALRLVRAARLAGVAIAFGSSGHTAVSTGPTAVIATTRLR